MNSSIAPSFKSTIIASPFKSTIITATSNDDGIIIKTKNTLSDLSSPRDEFQTQEVHWSIPNQNRHPHGSIQRLFSHHHQQQLPSPIQLFNVISGRRRKSAPKRALESGRQNGFQSFSNVFDEIAIRQRNYHDRMKIRHERILSLTPYTPPSAPSPHRILPAHDTLDLNGNPVARRKRGRPPKLPPKEVVVREKVGGGVADKVTGDVDVKSLDEDEMNFCDEIRVQPEQYLVAKAQLIQAYNTHGFFHKTAARRFVKGIDVNRLGKLWEYFVQHGWMPID